MLSSEAMEPCDLPPQGSMQSTFPLVQTHCEQTVCCALLERKESNCSAQSMMAAYNV